MALADLSRHAVTAQRSRERMRRGGVNMKGQLLWTDEEKELLRQNNADGYSSLKKLLPHRSLSAIKQQARAMGLRPKRRLWKASEITLLRKLYPTASIEELAAAFPDLPLRAIRGAANYHGFRRKRKQYKKTGIAALDGLMMQCLRANMYMSDLDKICHSRRYFRQANFRYNQPNYNHVVKAITFFEGKLEVQWPDDTRGNNRVP